MTFVLVLLAALLVAAPAAADPASLIIAGLGSAGVTVGVVGTAVIRIAVGVALSALGQALAANTNAAPAGGGVRTQTLTAGDTTPQSFVLGRYMTAGNLVAPEMSHGVDGDTRYRWSQWAGHHLFLELHRLEHRNRDHDLVSWQSVRMVLADETPTRPWT